MSKLKTQRTGASVTQFIGAIADESRRADCRALLKLMKAATGMKAEMWGDAIVGFGSFRYRMGHKGEAEWFLAGFSPRKQNLTVYLIIGYKAFTAELAKLGKHSLGGSCLYIKRLENIDAAVLKSIIAKGVKTKPRMALA